MGLDHGFDREFEFDDADFEFLTRLIKERAGIVIGDGKESMVYGRLVRRLRACQFTTFAQYRNFIGSPEGESEFYHFLNALTTNLTRFFRESHHFDHLESVFLPELVARGGGTGRKRLRIWSAGSSSGQEPYTIAMVLRKNWQMLKDWDVKILATDIDTNMIERSQRGVYGDEALQSIPEEYRKKFVKIIDAYGDEGQMTDEVRGLITFKRLNLLSAWPMKGPFDVIFCRNVAIYFDKDTQRVLFNRYADLISPNGYLYIGHSENLFNVTNRFKSIGKTIYKPNTQSD